MFKYAVIFLVISLIAGGIGLTNISVIAKRISMVFFALFFLGFLALLGFAYLLGEAFNAGARAELFAPAPLAVKVQASDRANANAREMLWCGVAAS
jgi:uncharacterized membrane protein YtjA (UPF0391 family)